MSHSRPKTPWHLWVVGVFLLLWQALASFDFVATVARFEPYLSGYPEDVLEYYYNAPLWMYAMWGIAAFGGLIGSILLLMRKKSAVPAFGLAWLCSLAAVFWQSVNPAPEGGGEPEFMIIVIIVALLLLLYMGWMQRRRVLN